jgi:hypothetical protein
MVCRQATATARRHRPHHPLKADILIATTTKEESQRLRWCVGGRGNVATIVRYDRRGIRLHSQLSHPRRLAIVMTEIVTTPSVVEGSVHQRRDEWVDNSLQPMPQSKDNRLHRDPRVSGFVLWGRSCQPHRLIAALALRQHPDKTFIGRSEKGFDFLGYRLWPDRIAVAEATAERFRARRAQLYEQESDCRLAAPLGLYVRRWLSWARGGLPIPVALPAAPQT